MNVSYPIQSIHPSPFQLVLENQEEETNKTFQKDPPTLHQPTNWFDFRSKVVDKVCGNCDEGSLQKK